jgi:hypothetical protein
VSPEQITDVLDCGNPQESWQTMIRLWRQRAVQSREIAKKLRADAQDALDRANEYDDAAHDFDGLADALEDASVTFPPGDKNEKPPGQPTPSQPHGHSVIA